MGRRKRPAKSHQLKLAITVGDPRGIGPEVVSAALADPRVQSAAEYVVIGSTDRRVGSSEAGRRAGDAVVQAVKLAQASQVDGIVTAPLDKSALLAGGYDYPGHTEMLATLTNSRVAMMLASDRLRVVLATTHIPLREVVHAVTPAAITEAAHITRTGLRDWFGIADPCLALCALNPHAGDHGRFGDEDDRVLKPAAIAAGIVGPLPADTVFVRAMRGEFDAVIAPYHDVGMTAIKVASFGEAVNVTLGLPFPRTSPDHGTALDIAGQGIADPSSMIAAILLCATIVKRQCDAHS